MSDWEEIKRLAADFQRTQASDTLQRISERNCIDIIKKLTELNLIELIYTCDGKEFLTPEHLQKEIRDEVFINGGRVHLHDLAATLNVDYHHVESMSKKIVADEPEEYTIVLGQIIHSTYKATLGKHVYETMILAGQISIADFSKTLDLPSEFLATFIKELMPKIMGSEFVASHDERTYYTTDMIEHYEAHITGTLMAITKPTTIASIVKKLDVPEKLFLSITDLVIKDGTIDGTIDGKLFVPAIYAREQNDWIDGFYSSNYYIEYDILLRRDIKQPKAFLKKRFPDGVQLKTCFVSPTLISQVEALVEDCIVSNSIIDISTVLPPSIQPEDIELILQDVCKKSKQLNASCLIIQQTNVCSLGCIATCKESFNSMMEARAAKHLKEGKLINYFLGGNTKPSLQPKPKGQQRDQQEQQGQPEQRDQQEQTELEPSKREDQEPGQESIQITQQQQRQQTQKKKKKKGKRYQADPDEEAAPKPTGKQARSNKGRAARREVSPEPAVKNPLVFLELEELVIKIKEQLRDSGEFDDELYETIASMLRAELDKTYEKRARVVLDEYLKAEAEKNESDNEESKIDADD